MDIEKYKAKLEAAIYENCGKYYIGEGAIKEVLSDYQEKLIDGKTDISEELKKIHKTLIKCRPH